jgi:two-component system, NarL family, nitrate/nitrite response regulator NarL
MLIDDHPVVLAGLKSFLREAPEMEIIATAANADEAVGRAEHLKPDVFLVTLTCAAPAPLDTTRALRARFPHVAIVVLGLDTACVNPKALAEAGANAFLDKPSGRDAVLAVLKQLRADEDTGARRLLPLRDSTPPPSSGSGSLSRRELQVLTLIADGHTNKQIADELGISVRTVETHRERLMRKLNVQGTAALTKAAIALGLVSTKA